QGFRQDQVGWRKVSAASAAVRAVSPAATVHELPIDFTALDDAGVRRAFAGVNLFVFATDSFAAQARGNQVALLLGVPAVWVGLFAGGLGGEVVFWHPGVTSCFRCLLEHRYAAQEEARKDGRRLDPPSDGVTIFDTGHVDTVAGHVVLGLLTRGAGNRFGGLAGKLGQRNYLLVKIDPDYRTAGRDLVREHLGVPETSEAFFGWTTAALSDPTAGRKVCPDCQKYRTPQAGDEHPTDEHPEARGEPASRQSSPAGSRTPPPAEASDQ
ncbi:MAG: ThiF family adenylyltransferase, partial [Gemmataceae bacterium]|nr:ThiF family adenylyltransferase [Gemmataceae bacterium]